MNKNKLTKSEKKIEKFIKEERNKRSQELFNKDEFQLDIAERAKLDQYIYDLGNPIWKPVLIDGKYKTHYEINNVGILLNTKTGKYMKPYINHKGYYGIILSYTCDGKNKKINTFIHRLVAQAFIPNPENKPQVNHINGIKICNWVGNLEWATNSENQKHAYDTGLHSIKRGIDHGHCQHTENEVHQVCKLLEMSVPISEIAEKLNVSRAFIIGIKYQGNWIDIRSQYNIPKSNTYGNRTKEQVEIIDKLIKDGNRNRKGILSAVGLPDTDTNISYVKYRIRIYNKNKIVNCPTTIKHSDVGGNAAS